MARRSTLRQDQMLYVENNNTDPYCNHALEEWLMENRPEDCFVLWRNQKAVLLGKNQDAHNEINLDYAKERGIKVVRRLTGGGTVYTDEGSVMFSFINASGRGFADFRRFTEPVVAALNALGVPAEFSGRNDLTINGLKFSGNAQCAYRGKLLHHGTLMYDTDISEMTSLLRVSELKLKDKGIASVQSRVTNIREHLAVPLQVEEFRSYLFDSVMQGDKEAVFLRLSDAAWNSVRAKAAAKHATPEWIYGHSPAFNVKKEAKLPGGLVQVCLSVFEGRIEQARIFGDFFGDGDIADVESALSGRDYLPEAIQAALAPLSFDQYFYNITLAEFMDIIF